MRRKSIGATSQAFHEPMSTGAFLEFLSGMQVQGLVGQVPKTLKPGTGAKTGTPPLMELYSSAFGNHPTPLKVSGLGVGSVLRRGPWVKSTVRVAGSRPQGPVGQVSRGLGARAPGAWGPADQGPAAFSPQTTIFSQTSWWEPREGVGVG